MKEKRLTSSYVEGFTLFIAIGIMATVLLVSMGIVALAVRQSVISGAGRDSQAAFYAADSGIECALYWDVADPSGESAFATSTTSQINCNGQDKTVGGATQSVFTINMTPDPYCVTITVTKEGDGDTIIESRGYNTCDLSNPRRVERAVRATY